MSLYLKYRPNDFNNLVWQSFVKETLQKAIDQNKTVWAYLFCGPRWTGKTTTARLLAKTINCKNPDKWNPCLECNICKDFADEKLIDIIEIDAASHTWVDNIRDLIEKAQFSPTSTKYKIYIIDEVHMLSKWAFNALLKILEEPPSHVKFILATTETHQVPETIISRCQRYDFKRISDTDISDRLNFIANSENVKIDKDSINYIIKNSSGWLRNAISLFEQFITDNKINYSDIVEKLEIVNEDIVKEFLKKLKNKDNSIIEIFDKLISDWKNIKLFFKELLFYTKDKALKKLVKNKDITQYISILEILDETYTNTKHSLDENTTFLIWVLKIIAVKPQHWITSTPKEKETIIDIPSSPPLNNSMHETSSISHNDVDDIFWEPEIKKEKTAPVIKNQTNNESASDSNLDINNFIAKLKENWAKWWLTMAVRWSSLRLWDNDLIIWAKTKIAKTQFENVDNQSLILKALSNMWLSQGKITIN